MSTRYRPPPRFEPEPPAPEARDSRARRSARRTGATIAAAALCVGGGQGLTSAPASAAPIPGCTPSAGFNHCQLFYGTSTSQSFTVPAGVTSIHADLKGSGGGGSLNFDDPLFGGHGGKTSATVAVTPGHVLGVTVGTLTFGGGGTSGTGTRGSGGVGGGLSGLWTGTAFESGPYLIAGGGGGASGAGQGNPNGGSGGGLSGGTGTTSDGEPNGGTGGTQSAAGTAGPAGTDAIGYQGGNGGPGADGGGGGGGGWHGGGGGGGQANEGDNNNDGGGGGGSGYVGGPGVTGASTAAGEGADPAVAGEVLVQWYEPVTPPAPPVHPAPPAPPAAHAKVLSPSTSVRYSIIPATCSLGGAHVYSCSVTAYAIVSGHYVAVGYGKAVRAAGHETAALPVNVVLNSHGTAVARRPGGVRLRLVAQVRQTGSQSTRAASTVARAIAPQVTIKKIHFAFDSAHISAHSRTYLQHVRHQMGPVTTISCTGHTDYAGENAHEKKLSRLRAKHVCAVLARFHSRVRTHVKGVGGAHPITRKGTALSRKANRYAKITLKY